MWPFLKIFQNLKIFFFKDLITKLTLCYTNFPFSIILISKCFSKNVTMWENLWKNLQFLLKQVSIFFNKGHNVRTSLKKLIFKKVSIFFKKVHHVVTSLKTDGIFYNQGHNVRTSLKKVWIFFKKWSQYGNIFEKSWIFFKQNQYLSL